MAKKTAKKTTKKASSQRASPTATNRSASPRQDGSAATADRDVDRLLELWRAENPTKTRMSLGYLIAQSLLVAAVVRAGDLQIAVAVLGVITSIWWWACIGRTVEYQRHWRQKLEALASSSSPAHPLPTAEAERKFPPWGRVPSRLILLAAPTAGSAVWLIAAVYMVIRLFV